MSGFIPGSLLRPKKTTKERIALIEKDLAYLRTILTEKNYKAAQEIQFLENLLEKLREGDQK